jgi:hypothetical protein
MRLTTISLAKIECRNELASKSNIGAMAIFTEQATVKSVQSMQEVPITESNMRGVAAEAAKAALKRNQQ